MLDLNQHPVLLVMMIAVVAPLLAEIPIGFRVPESVLQMVLGIVVGPQVLGLAKAEGLLGWMGGTLGLAALFLAGGMELDLERVWGRTLSLAVSGWVMSLALGLSAAALLYVLPFVNAPLMVAVALTTTAVGTLLPILRDSGGLETTFGRLLVAAGAMGEFAPVVVISLVLTREYNDWVQVSLMLEDSIVSYRLGKTLEEISAAARSLRLLADTLNHQPESVIFGKKNTGGK